MDIRRTSFESGDTRSPTLDKMAKKRKENVRKTSTSSDSTTGAEKEPIPMIPDPKVVPIEMSGNLHKQGRLLKKWKPRFFQIQGNSLYYYKNYEKKECLGLIDLLKCYYIGKSPGAASFGSAFELQTWGRVHLLAARDERDADKWIDAIKKKMVPEARDRDKKGTKGEVVSVIPDEVRSRRATIKMPKTDKKPNVKPSSSLHEMRLGKLKSLEEDEEKEEPDTGKKEEEPGRLNVTTSQSYPNFKSEHAITPIHKEQKQDQESMPTPENRKEIMIEKNTASSNISPKPVKQVSVPPDFQLPPVADMDLPLPPPPLDMPPCEPLKQPDSMSKTTSPHASATFVPMAKEKPPASSFATQPQWSDRPPLTRPMSVADIELPPPPSLVPMKRANTLSDIKLPPPIDFQIPQTTGESMPMMDMDLPPLLTIDATLPAQDPTGINNTCIPLPPPPDSLEMPQLADLSSLPSIPMNVEPIESQVVVSPPKPDALNQDLQNKIEWSNAELEHLKGMLPPLDPVDHIPSAIDQLKFVLTNDQAQSSDTSQYSLLPELKKTWLSEKNGIEQLRHFLNVYQ